MPDRSQPSGPPAHAPEGEGLNLRELTKALQRRWRLFLGLIVGVVAVVMTLTLLIPPIYETEATLRVRPDRTEGPGGGIRGMMSGLEDALPMGISLPGMGETDVQTEIGVLGSRRIVEPVADSLALHVSLVRPFHAFRTEVLHVLEAGESAPRGLYTLRRRGDGTYTVSARMTREPVEIPDRVSIGEPFRIGPMLLELAPELAEDPPRAVWFQVAPYRRMIQKLRRDLKIQRDDAGSRLVEVAYRHRDPHLARALVNGMAERFLEYAETTNKSDSRREAEILSGYVASYATQLREAEQRLQEFQEAERVIHPEEQAIAQVERIAEVLVARDAMEVERDALTELLRTVETRDPRGVGETPYRQLATFPSFITNSAVQELLQALTGLENRRSELLVRRTEENIDVRMVQRRIRDIEEQLHDLARDYLESLETQIASASVTLARFDIEVEQIPAVELEYARRYRDRRLLSEIYLALEGRLADARVQEAIDDARIRVVDLGVVEDRPAFPRPTISLVLSMVLGLMVGLFGVVMVETSSPRIRGRGDAESTAGAPVLGTVPGLGRGRVIPFVGRGREAPETLVARDDPWHPASEAFRGIATALAGSDPAPRLVLVAGLGPGEGRSVAAANVALAAARAGRKVALVDADLRQRSVPDLFGLVPRPGWTGALGPRADEASPAQRVETGGLGGGSLDVFPGGEPPVHPLEVLATSEFRDFLDRLREAYDLTILDSPALRRGHDALVLAPLVDGVLLVARVHETPREDLHEAAEGIRRAGGSIAGVILNDPKARSRAPAPQRS